MLLKMALCSVVLEHATRVNHRETVRPLPQENPQLLWALLPGLILQVVAVSGLVAGLCPHSPGLTGLWPAPEVPIQEAETKRVTAWLGLGRKAGRLWS